MINEDINEIIEQIFTFNDIFNEKNSLRIEEVFFFFFFFFYIIVIFIIY